MSSDPKIANHNNIVLLRAEPHEEGHRGHPRGVLLIQVDPERKLVHMSASVLSHTEPKPFSREEGIAIAATREPGATARAAIFMRCEDPDGDVRNAHRVDALRHAEAMAVEAILAVGTTYETMNLLNFPDPQAVLTAIIYALQGRGGADVKGSIAAVENKRTEQAKKDAEFAQAQSMLALQKLTNQLRRAITDSGFGTELAEVENFVAKAFESARESVTPTTDPDSASKDASA